MRWQKMAVFVRLSRSFCVSLNFRESTSATLYIFARANILKTCQKYETFSKSISISLFNEKYFLMKTSNWFQTSFILFLQVIQDWDLSSWYSAIHHAQKVVLSIQSTSFSKKDLKLHFLSRKLLRKLKYVGLLNTRPPRYEMLYCLVLFKLSFTPLSRHILRRMKAWLNDSCMNKQTRRIDLKLAML